MVRTVETFVMRLLVDSDDPHTLRGSLYSVMHGDEYIFPDQVSLISLLDKIIRLPPMNDGELGPRQPKSSQANQVQSS
jgi:hypothetical protein